MMIFALWGPRANPAKRVARGKEEQGSGHSFPRSGKRSWADFATTRRRQRRLKNRVHQHPVFLGVWGRQPPTSKRRVYTRALLAHYLATT